VRQSRLSLRAAGLLIGLASVALIAFQPSDSAGAAGLSTGRQTGSAGATAAQVGSRLVIDNLAESATGHSGSRHPSAGGALTIALASLHLPAPARPSAPLRSTHPATPVPPVPVTAPATTVPAPTPAPVPAPAPTTPAPAPPAPTAPAGPLAPSAAVWAELRECESGDNYAIDTGNGYYGAYQFSASTWAALGYPGLPNQAPPAVQDQAAQRLEAMSGWGPWPGCSAKLGL
jgi:Transglycosylase-like domain